jgi:hypothetical protein
MNNKRDENNIRRRNRNTEPPFHGYPFSVDHAVNPVWQANAEKTAILRKEIIRLKKEVKRAYELLAREKAKRHRKEKPAEMPKG